MIRLTLYSRSDCHLCEDMKATVRRVAAGQRLNGQDTIEITEIDISGSTELETLYGLEVPVLLVNGRKAAKYRIAEQELTRLLEKTEG